MVASLLLTRVARYIAAAQNFFAHDAAPESHHLGWPPFAFSEEWHIVGPFQIGTREAIWGADPLEYDGGFHALQYAPNATFRSSLAFNGTVTWSTSKANLAPADWGYASADLDVSFENIDWAFLQQVYGWAALQWQGWARGQIIVQSEQTETVTLNAAQALEFWVDDRHYFGGDFYSFDRAPTTLRLEPGVHTIDVRLVRDVRAMGGMSKYPSVALKLELRRSTPGLHQQGHPLFPDRLNDHLGPLASSYASVVIRNDDTSDIFIASIEAQHNVCTARLVAPTPIKLVPGQSRPIGFQIGCVGGTSVYASIRMHLKYYVGHDQDHERSMFVGILPRSPQPMYGPHMFTFLHPSGIVSYAILKPPSPDAQCPHDKSLPILLLLHGAGVEADSDMSKHSIDDIPDLCAWVLIPTGVTTWSGDDWHNWGFSDVEAAISALPDWIEQVEWTGPGVDTNNWVVSGHSNGGQGTWYALTHYPDKILAAAPVSGYSSIQNYVPYTLWQPADPGRTAVLQARLNSYRHELMLENAQGIPILQQHGSEDDNVPAYHSRLMYDLLHRAGAGSDFVEVEGKPHWWDGVMSTQPLSAFYQTHLGRDDQHHSNLTKTSKFSIVTSNPGDTGSKYGFQIIGLQTPEQFGRLEVDATSAAGCYNIQTFNVQSFKLPGHVLAKCQEFFVDDIKLAHPTTPDPADFVLSKTLGGRWAYANEQASFVEDSLVRTRRQQGGMEAILRTNGAFQIVQHSRGTEEIALQVSRNLFQYFSADTEISESVETALSRSGNIISVSIGADLPPSFVSPALECSVLVGIDSIALGREGAVRNYTKVHGHVAAAAFLRPLQDERLELVVWAVDVDSLSIAARLVPLVTGSGQPDFVVADRRMLDMGLEGVVAMGFFDASWCPSSNSFFA